MATNTKQTDKESEFSPVPLIRKVMHTKTTRLLSMGRIIPESWKYVKIFVNFKGDNDIFLQLKRIWNDGEDAQGNGSNQTDKPHTQETR